VTLRGSCNCGSVRFEITEPLTNAGYCHCKRCQKRTGAAAGASGQLVPGSLHVLAGEEHTRIWKPDGGNWKVFCTLCGAGVWTLFPDGTQNSVRLGVLDDDPGIEPTYRAWTDSAASWEDIPDDGLTRYPGKRPDPRAQASS